MFHTNHCSLVLLEDAFVERQFISIVEALLHRKTFSCNIPQYLKCYMKIDIAFCNIPRNEHSIAMHLLHQASHKVETHLIFHNNYCTVTFAGYRNVMQTYLVLFSFFGYFRPLSITFLQTLTRIPTQKQNKFSLHYMPKKLVRTRYMSSSETLSHMFQGQMSEIHPS